MLTEFLRDQCFTTAWFGLMAFVWFGWSQEDPPRAWRVRLGVGSGLGVAFAAGFGVLTALNWSQPTALQGKYVWFGVLVAAEVVLAGLGCLLLARRGQSRWMAWWVAVVVAVHFLPLALFLSDFGVAAVGVAQLAALGWAVPRLRAVTTTSSRLAGPIMGVSLLISAVIGAALALPNL
ncbi:hypothetical protein ABZ816_15000 [Actinosynnema sp. NPDC047251]|uniref:Putative membrane protein n=1 Tax=Saccharothrix espanaensis (strain ATCC 51144 / DSM 44229 / JCM 9112 / NBRC 15066 / NRRL 15764) TaxID=1179773 RepID=K0JW46_SACES|nr:hypothetical protein [Saccharothrix espanaensis]CCH29672.1 putative membrane protein [Saccharothrix espanaensis DSM 44229]